MKKPTSFKLHDQVRLKRAMKRYEPNADPSAPPLPGVPKNSTATIEEIWQSDNTDALYLLACDFETETIPVLASDDDITLERRAQVTAVNNAQSIPIDVSPTAVVELPEDHRLRGPITRLGDRINDQNAYLIPSIENACTRVIGAKAINHLNNAEQELLTLLERMHTTGATQAIVTFQSQP